MNSPIFRAVAPLVFGIMFIYSVFVLLTGHNQPGGGFIGGLIAAASIAVYLLAEGADEVRRRMVVSPAVIAGSGVVIASVSGLISFFAGVPFLTGLWHEFILLDGQHVALSTPLMFDLGVYLVVVGSISGVIIELAREHEDE